MKRSLSIFLLCLAVIGISFFGYLQAEEKTKPDEKNLLKPFQRYRPRLPGPACLKMKKGP